MLEEVWMHNIWVWCSRKNETLFKTRLRLLWSLFKAWGSHLAASVCKASTWYTGWVSLQGQFGESVCRVSRQRQIAGPVLVNRQNFTDIGCSPMKYLPIILTLWKSILFKTTVVFFTVFKFWIKSKQTDRVVDMNRVWQIVRNVEKEFIFWIWIFVLC